ncbi:Glycosyltransferase, GT2 family [Bradyrhizobium shewense]|uniref:Glycosyltransferase, GT2 family n=1 Tax=Bradyrhizobium shewense TaxID=1761772 RepID=A0A1C3VGT5_9BRAD|nr:glycosyltransferase family A protein [Bradyrhizobium shewense]SCB26899.1 Glycosyltransferase, GT2 family [Bradyrhizobium shewense]
MSNEAEAIIDRAAHATFDVAVVIPTFNRATTILETLKSVLKQTLPVNEIIIVDDCSSDETVCLVESVRSSIVRVMRNQTNVGAAESRNRGAFATKNSWIAFLDSDDVWTPDKLEQDLRALERNPDAIAIASNHVAETDGGNLQPATRKERIAEPLALLKVENYLGTCSTMTVRREALASIGGFTPFLKSCQDWDLWIRIARRGTIAIARPGSVFYRVTSNANISLDGKKRRAGHVFMWKTAIRPCKRDTKTRSTLALTFADIAANLNKRRSFRRLCMYSMKSKPSNAVIAGLMLISIVGAPDYRTYRTRVVRRLGTLRAARKVASHRLLSKRTND